MNIIEKIKKIKAEKGITILAHNYIDGAIQDLADFVGDSLELSIKAREVKAKILLFAGVQFMGETAKILSPKTKVLLPRIDAGCPMADMATAAAVRYYKKNHPNTVAVAYVNSTAATKAEVDICCTSANVKKVIESIPIDKEIIFLPDANLGKNVAKMTNREMDFWHGCCPIHDAITQKMIEQARQRYPHADLLIHPEATPEVVALCDYALSTGGMLRHVQKSLKNEFIIATECGLIHRMKKENPNKHFYALSDDVLCPDMKKITLEDVLRCLETETYEVVLDPVLIERASHSINRMLAIK